MIEEVPGPGESVFAANESPPGEYGSSDDVTRLLGHVVAQSGGRFFGVVGVGACVGLLQGIGLLLLIPLLTIVETGQQSGVQDSSRLRGMMVSAFEGLGLPVELPVIVVVFAAMMVASAVLVAVNQLATAQLATGYAAALRSDLDRSLQRASWLTISRTSLSAVRNAQTAGVSRTVQAVTSLTTVISTVLIVAVYLLVAFQLSAMVSITVLAVGVALWRMSESVGHQDTSAVETLLDARAGVQQEVRNSVQSLKLSKVFSQGFSSNEAARSIERAHERLDESRLEVIRRSAHAELVFGIGGAIALSTMLYLGSAVADMHVADLIVLVIVFSRILPRIGTLNSQWHVTRRAVVGHVQLRAVIDTLSRGAEPDTDGVPPISIERSLELHDVSVRHSGRDRRALDTVTVHIPARRITVLAGQSGAGKSTMADVLIGLLPPGQGTIAVDGVPLDDVGTIGLRKASSFLPQQVTLIKGTVRENVLFGRSADDAAVIRALEAASASEFVEALPSKLDEILRSDGLGLSGGEQQRIALARALLVEPQILVLDEPDSALDAETARSVRAAIAALAGRVTVVMISHGRALEGLADNLVVLRNGKVVGAGAPADLLEHELDVVREAARQVAGNTESGS